MKLHRYAKTKGIYLLHEKNYWLLYSNATGKVEATYFDIEKNLVIGTIRIKCHNHFDAINAYLNLKDRGIINRNSGAEHAARSL